VFLRMFPDTPADAKWLTPPERDWISNNVHPIGAKIHHPAEPIHRILIDPRVWQVSIFGCLLLTCSYSYIFSLPQIVQSSTQLSIAKVGFITSGINLLGVPAMLLGALFSDRSPTRRQQHVIPCCLVMAAGFIAAGLSNLPLVTIPALCCVSIGFYAMQGAWLTIIPGIFRGRSAAAAIAAVNTLCILGGFIGPYYMGILKDLTGTYQRGLATLSIPMLLCTAIMLYLHRQFHRAPTAPISAPILTPDSPVV